MEYMLYGEEKELTSEEVFEKLSEDGVVRGVRLRDYVLKEKKIELSIEVLASCYRRADVRRKGFVTREEFVNFFKDVDQQKEAVSGTITMTAAAGAGTGFLVGGPVGMILFGGLGVAYGMVSGWRNTQAATGGAALLGLTLGPGGLLVGAVIGSLTQSYGDQSYLGEAKSWYRFTERAICGETERRGIHEECIKEKQEARPGLAICGSGGGLRAATAFLALLAELEDTLVPEASHVAALSGSCWSLAALLESNLKANEFLPEFGARLKSDLRLPRSAWRTGVADEKAKEAWVFNRFAARRNQGHQVGVADIWGAHLTANLLSSQKNGGYGLGQYANSISLGEQITPIFTAVEAVPVGPMWSGAKRCEMCSADFGVIIGKSRHHCRACGKSVCDDCSVVTEQRRCTPCVTENREAPRERTSWRWWEFTPQGIGPVDCTKTPVHIFGRRDSDRPILDQVAGNGGEPVGQLMGVWGSAFTATVERYEVAGAIGETSAKIARAIADPLTSDPGQPLLRPASFHYGPEIFGDSIVFLGDAGFSSNLPLPPVLHRGCDIIFCLDASAYSTANLRKDIAIEVTRAIHALQDMGCTRIFFDLEAYANDPVSFHTVRPPNKSTDSLLIVLTLANNSKLDFDPLANAAAGGFCSSSTPSYEPADYDRLVNFVRQKVKSQLPLILDRIHNFRSEKIDLSDSAS